MCLALMLALAPLVDHHQHLFSPAVAQLVSVKPITGDELIALLDRAGIRRAVVLSVAYTWGNPARHVTDEVRHVREENDWVAAEAAKHPGRLRAFCSVNPLRDYALEEIERCSKFMHGLKLHFGNSAVDLHDADHVARVRRVFAAANLHRMPIVVHLRASVSRKLPYGRAEARIFVEQILPAAPDVVVQIAHLAGTGGVDDPPADEALEELIPVERLWFDVAGLVERRLSAAEARAFVARLRRVGLHRVLYGSDAAAGGNLAPREAWQAFRRLPLTAAEFDRIAHNVAPYMKSSN